MKCKRCKEPAVVALPSHHTGFCPDCYQLFFSRQVEKAIKKRKMFTHEDRVLVALSGGKDSLGLMNELARLEYDVTGMHVDLGIPGSSEQARHKVENFCTQRNLPLITVELEKEGIPIPKVKDALKRPVCSSCGKIKRYFFNKIAQDHNFSVLATGHNLDDEVSRLFSNLLRWDVGYLSDQGPNLPAEEGFTRKVKPFYRVSEFESANYCFLQGVDLHKGICPYSKGASFTTHKKLWADLEFAMPGQKLCFYEGFLDRGQAGFNALEQQEGPKLTPCTQCGSPTSADTCGVCRIREAVAKYFPA